MSLKFPSQEWADQFKQEIKNSDAYVSAAKTWEGDVLLGIDGGGGLYLDLWHGECRAATYVTGEPPKKPEFKISANMDNWLKVLNGKLDPIQGLMTRQLKLDGNLVKIMKHVKAAQELVRCATRVPTEVA